MGGLFIVCLLSGGVSTALSAEPALERFEFRQVEMAIPAKIILYANDDATAERAAKAAFARFHELNAVLSDYDPQSELRRLCDTAGEGKAVRVSEDLRRVLERSVRLSELSDGAFDVTIGPVVHLWRNARRTKELPSQNSINKALAKVGYRSMRLDPQRQTVELLKPGMRLDLGGVAKGYAVDEALKELQKHGIARAMIEAGGNIGLADPPPDKPGWRIGIAPPEVGAAPRQYLTLSRCAISTSGDLWQYAIIGGVRYSHLIDPRSGSPLTDRYSVTVVGPNGLGTDGVSSAAAILGPERGLKLMESTPGSAGFIVRRVDDREQTFESKGWKGLGVRD